MDQNMSIEDVRNIVQEFIYENFIFGYDEDAVDCDMSLLDMGVIDSTGIIELVLFLEEEFDIMILDPDIVPENLDSINRISKYVYAKRKPA